MTLSPRASVPGLLLSLAMAGCGTGHDRATGAPAVRVDTIGDTIIVRTLSSSRGLDTARLDVELSIGVADGPDEYILGEPGALAVAPDGNILVLDVQVPVVRVFGPDGQYLRNLGRSGSGPGEYESPDGMAVLSDGRVLVRDPPNGRIGVFDAEGNWLEQWHLSGGFNTSRRFYVDRGDTAYVTTLLERGVGPWDWEFALIRYSPNGEILDTIPAPTWDHQPAQVTASRENSRTVRAVPFTPRTAWTFSPLGYMVGALSTDYRVDLYVREGPVIRIEREWSPVPVRKEEADEQRDRITAGLQRQYGGWRWNGPGIPDTKPPFRELFTSAEGNIWVQLSTEGVAVMTTAEARQEEAVTGRIPLRFEEPPAFDVFTPDGRYLGPVGAPVSLRVEPEPIVMGDRMWAVTRDSLDVATIVRFRILR